MNKKHRDESIFANQLLQNPLDERFWTRTIIYGFKNETPSKFCYNSDIIFVPIHGKILTRTIVSIASACHEFYYYKSKNWWYRRQNELFAERRIPVEDRDELYIYFVD